MTKRSFNRDFRELVDEDDCLTEDMSSARSLANRQQGQWKVYSYRPSHDVPQQPQEGEAEVTTASNESAEEQEVSESDCIMMCKLAAAYLM